VNLRQINFESEVLKGNPFNDPHNRRVVIIEPKDAIGKPIIIYLSGYFSSSLSLLNYTITQLNIIDRIGILEREKKVKGSIIVLPDTLTKVGGNQYLDSKAIGFYESFIARELIPFLKDSYKTDRVGIIGRSSGGFGALNLAMKGYDINAIAAHSPDVYFEYAYLPIIPIAYREIRKVKEVKEYINLFWSKEEKSKREMLTMMVIGLSAFYSNTENIELPFDLSTGEIDYKVWNNWLRKDPLRRSIEEFERLKRLKMIYLDVGNKDEYNLDIGVRMLHKKLLELKVPHYYEEYNGGHNTPSRLNISLPLIENSLLY